MKLVFFGTSDYCLPILESLNSNFDLKLVVTRPDKPVGRKKILTPSATKTWANEHKIPVLTPSTLKKDTPDRLKLELRLKQDALDLAVVSDFGLIIPERIFNTPKMGTLNVHFSKLPFLRGPSPVQFTLLRGDTEAWVTIFKLENPPELEIKMDSGPILWQQSFPIVPNDTTQTLYTRLFVESAKYLPEVIKDYCLQTTDNRITLQDHSKATYCRFLTKEDGFIEYETLQKAIAGEEIGLTDIPKVLTEALKTNASPGEISNFKFQILNLFDLHRALSPWPTLWTIKDGKRMIIRKCHIEGEKLILDEIQFEGEKTKKIQI